MGQKFISFFHNNTQSNLQNLIFDVKRKNEIEAPIYRCFRILKQSLEKRKILLNTYDVSTKYPPYTYIHIDLPFPIPSNLHIWNTILSNRRKNILIITEPSIVNPFNYMKIFHPFFKKIYIANDDWVDNKKYFKLFLPKSILGIKVQTQKFKEKKFLNLMNSNKLPFYPFKLMSTSGKELYSERINAIEFFERKIPNDFQLYGRGWNDKKKFNISEFVFGYKHYSTYKGGFENKIKLLSGFKYSICFENITNVEGYISEKIFDCFKAKCIPIYWGATNIEKYIPKDCFIDYRNFGSYEKLLTHLISIDEKRYNRYIKNIERLLADKKFKDLWVETGFVKFFIEDVLEIK